MRLNPWRLILPLCLAGAIFAVVGLHAAAPASCVDADQARYTALLTQAQKEYTAILADEPTSTCARTGLKQVAIKLCTRADRLARRNGKPRTEAATEQAKATYVAVLKIEPGGSQRDCAVKGLEALPDPSGDGQKQACDCAQTCPCGEVDDPDPDDPEKQDPEHQDAEHQDPEHQDPEHQDPEIQEPEIQDPEWTG
jgi:hypothetical protein